MEQRCLETLLSVAVFPALDGRRVNRLGHFRLISRGQECRQLTGHFRHMLFLHIARLSRLLLFFTAFRALRLRGMVVALEVSFLSEHAIAMIGMLVVIFCQHAVAGGQRVTRLREVFLARRRIVLARTIVMPATLMMVRTTVAASSLETRLALLVVVSAVL